MTHGPRRAGVEEEVVVHGGSLFIKLDGENDGRRRSEGDNSERAYEPAVVWVQVLKGERMAF